MKRSDMISRSMREAAAMKIIESGTPGEIYEWIMRDFHAVKHTDAFIALTRRLNIELDPYGEPSTQPPTKPGWYFVKYGSADPNSAEPLKVVSDEKAGLCVSMPVDEKTAELHRLEDLPSDLVWYPRPICLPVR
jgi:hypothetical protein